MSQFWYDGFQRSADISVRFFFVSFISASSFSHFWTQVHTWHESKHLLNTNRITVMISCRLFDLWENNMYLISAANPNNHTSIFENTLGASIYHPSFGKYIKIFGTYKTSIPIFFFNLLKINVYNITHRHTKRSLNDVQ